MITKLCHICYEDKQIQQQQQKQPNKLQCINVDCNVFICEECLKIWYKEKKECPICHKDIENGINDEINDDINIIEEQIIDTATCYCKCSSWRCYQIENEDRKIVIDSLLVGIKITIGFLVLGFLGYNIIYFIELRSFDKVISETKDNYIDPGFYLWLIMLGISFASGSLVFIGCCLSLSKICSLDE